MTDQAIPKSFIRMPATAAIAAARRTKPRNIFAAGMPGMLPGRGWGAVNERAGRTRLFRGRWCVGSAGFGDLLIDLLLQLIHQEPSGQTVGEPRIWAALARSPDFFSIHYVAS
jgi:hypothetical protein